MKWDYKISKEYDFWEQSKQGTFALYQEKKLLLSLIYDWRRRGQALLEIGCGTGYFLEMFWEAGFDVTGLDSSPDMLNFARARMGTRSTLKVGKAEYLDFEDNEFDYVALLTVLEFLDNPVQALKEACRVSRKGIIIGFLNKYSFYYLNEKFKVSKNKINGPLAEAEWKSCLEIKKLMRKSAGFNKIESGSVLIGPQFTWKFKAPGEKLNTLLSPFHCGAYSAVKGNYCKEKINTPLLAWKAEVKAT